MKYAVSGGAGFLGRATVARIHELGHTAVSIDRNSNGQSGEDRWKMDVRNRAGMISAIKGCDHVIHLAGVLGTSELFETPDVAIEVNVTGTLHVLEACREAGATFTSISMPPVFPSVYTATKVCAMRMASAFHNAYDLPVSHVTAYNAFGPGQAHGDGHPRKIIPSFSFEAWRNMPITIWGSGNQSVDLIHTDDLARMLVDATNFGDDARFDGGTGCAWTVNQIAEKVNEIVGSEAGINHQPMRIGETETKIYAIGEGWDRLDWQPRFREEQLVEAVNSYREMAEAES